MRLALISMPWQNPYSPSIQLGSLSAYLKAQRPNVEVDSYSFFLELADAIGLPLSKLISVHWFGEALFAYMLFPDQAESISTYLERSRRDDPAFESIDFQTIIEQLRVALLRRLNAIDWSQYRIVGLSVVFSQMMASVLAAREIKRRAPHAAIVFGGPSCTNIIGKSLLETFPFIDYVVNGEGERPLVALVDALGEEPTKSYVNVPAVVHRESPLAAFGVVDQMADMSSLPVPDYSDYFTTLARTTRPDEAEGRIRIPVETSRGCWWDRSHVDPMLSCTFCNLNLQWHGYREKSVDQSLAEIEELATKHQQPDFTLVDNILRFRQTDLFIEGLRKLDLGLDLWLEARASVKPDQIRRLSEVGGRVIQFGVEALSSSMLKKMVKGTTTLQNLQAMKFCEQYDVKSNANLIIEYPGMDESDILETLENIEFARCYRPVCTTEFSLVYQAPAYKAPEKFDISNVRNYHMYKLLLPPQLYERLFLTEKSFDSESLQRLKPLWTRVRHAVGAWTAHYDRMRPKVEGNLLLSLQDGGSYIKIRDFRWDEPRFLWLRDVERDVYLECSEIITIAELCGRFPSLDRGRIEALIERWREMKLVFREGEKVMSLAMPWGPVSKRRSVPLQRKPRLTVIGNQGAEGSA